MSFQAFTSITAPVVVLLRNDIDTDQVVPKRFLTSIRRTGWENALFHDWRLTADGAPIREFPLNDPKAIGAAVLVAGANFGCGSSREHAVWALQQSGFRAVIASSFGDIFENNSLRLGLLPVRLSEEDLAQLSTGLETGDEITIDLEDQEVYRSERERYRFAIDPFYRSAIMAGMDEIGMTLEYVDDIDKYEAAHGSRVSTAGLK